MVAESLKETSTVACRGEMPCSVSAAGKDNIGNPNVAMQVSTRHWMATCGTELFAT